MSTAPAWISVPLGIVLGKRLVHRINTVLFERWILVLLVAGALVLFVTGEPVASADTGSG